MRSWLAKRMMAAAIALLALSCGAWAQDNDGCTNATLKGDYAFAVTEWTLSSAQLWVPEFVVGIAEFDGTGKLTQTDYQAGSGPTGFRTGETGSYTVNPDCTGAGEIDLNVGGVGTGHGVIKLMFVVSNGGRAIHAVVSQFTPPFATQPVIDQIRSDFWKVGSEQDN
jgi:hypothetical protein